MEEMLVVVVVVVLCMGALQVCTVLCIDMGNSGGGGWLWC